MRVAVKMTFNKLAYHNDFTWEQQIENAKNMMADIVKEKEDGRLIDVYGLPGQDSTLWIYEVASLEELEELFTNNLDRYLTYEVHYLTDFEAMMKMKLEKWTS